MRVAQNGIAFAEARVRGAALECLSRDAEISLKLKRAPLPFGSTSQRLGLTHAFRQGRLALARVHLAIAFFWADAADLCASMKKWKRIQLDSLIAGEVLCPTFSFPAFCR